MKKTLLTIALLGSLSAGLHAQTALPYSHGFENATGWQLFRKGATPTYKWELKTDNPFAGTSKLYHDYPVGGGPATTDDWYVSPPFSLTSGGKIDSLRTRFAGFGNPAAGDTVAIYLLKGSADPATASSKILLYDFRDTKYTNDNAWKKISNITIPSTTGTCYIAFRYMTVVNWLDVSFDNLGISGNATGILSPSPDIKVSVAPNPATGQLNILTKGAFDRLRIYDMTGKKVQDQEFKSTVSIAALPAGTYVLEITDHDQHTGRTLIVKK